MDYRVQTLPYDILATIADQLALDCEVPEKQAGSITALRALSQTCKLMVPVCRRQLFSSILLRGNDITRYQNLMKLFQEKCEIASYVKELRYCLTSRTRQYEDGILEALLRYSKLSGRSSALRRISFTASSHTGIEWSMQTRSLKRLLITLIQLPTITDLHLGGIQDFPVNELLLCRSLRHLKLYKILDFSLDVDIPIPADCRSPTPLSLDVSMTSYSGLAIVMDPELGPNSVGPIVDFSLLQEVIFTVYDPPGVVQICELLKMAWKLERLSIRGKSISCIYYC